MCFVDLEKAFDRVQRKVLVWAMRKKGIQQILVRSLMSLYKGAKTRVRVDSELSEKFEVKVGMHQEPVLRHIPFPLKVDGALSELLYADDLVQLSETIEGLRNKFLKWKEAFESNGLRVNFGKPR